MNIAEIEDPTVLKALAYDQLRAIDVAKYNLSMIEQRLQALQNVSLSNE